MKTGQSSVSVARGRGHDQSRGHSSFPNELPGTTRLRGGPAPLRPLGWSFHDGHQAAPPRACWDSNGTGLVHLPGATMTSNSDLMSDAEQEDAFEVQMRGYSRRQVDEFVARSRSQIRELEERLSRSLDDSERLRLELSAARQGLSNKPAHEEVSEQATPTTHALRRPILYLGLRRVLRR